jgi:hypothetical protein
MGNGAVNGNTICATSQSAQNTSNRRRISCFATSLRKRCHRQRSRLIPEIAYFTRKIPFSCRSALTRSSTGQTDSIVISPQKSYGFVTNRRVGLRSRRGLTGRWSPYGEETCPSPDIHVRSTAADRAVVRSGLPQLEILPPQVARSGCCQPSDGIGLTGREGLVRAASATPDEVRQSLIDQHALLILQG